MTVMPTAISSPETRAVLHYWRTRTLGSQINVVFGWVVAIPLILVALFGFGGAAFLFFVGMPLVVGLAAITDSIERGSHVKNYLAQGMSQRILASAVARKTLYNLGSTLIFWLAMLLCMTMTSATLGVETNEHSDRLGVSFVVDSSGVSLIVDGPEGTTPFDGFVTAIATQPQWWIIVGSYMVLTALAGVYAGFAVSLVFHSCANLPPMVRPVIITATFVGLLVATYLCLVPVTMWAFAKAMQQFNQSRAISAAS